MRRRHTFRTLMRSSAHTRTDVIHVYARSERRAWRRAQRRVLRGLPRGWRLISLALNTPDA